MKTDISDYSILELQVLWLLRKEGHGYELLKELGKRRGKELTAGTLYPMLKKFEKNKLIGVAKKGERGKKVYKLTAKGKKELNGACKEFVSLFSEVFNSFVCKKCGKD